MQEKDSLTAYNVYVMLNSMKPYKTFKSELLKDRDVRKAYQELGPMFSIIEQLIEQRLKKNLSQADLAKKICTKQSAISRFESGDYNPTLAFLHKIADALNVTLNVTVLPKQKES